MSIIERALDKLAEQPRPLKRAPADVPEPPRAPDGFPELPEAALDKVLEEVESALEQQQRPPAKPVVSPAVAKDAATGAATPLEVEVAAAGKAADAATPVAPVAEAPVADEPVALAAARETAEAVSASQASGDAPPVAAVVEEAPAEEPAPDDAAAPQYDQNFIEINLERLGTAGFVTPETTDRVVAEEFRMVKRPLLMKAAADALQNIEKSNLILVTSSVPGEGKTFTSINLAMSIAMELDKTVLLVDADVYKADVSRVLEIPSRVGLLDYLMGEERDLSKLLLRTTVPKLTVLPSGKHAERATELFASDEMERLAHELATRYHDRIVIFDSAPLLATSGSSVLAHLVGQIVMVVEAVRTPRSAVSESISLLRGNENVGLVLNKSRRAFSTGYRYGYYYGYGGRD